MNNPAQSYTTYQEQRLIEIHCSQYVMGCQCVTILFLLPRH